MRGAVKYAYQIRESGFDTPANRQRIGFVGGLGAVYPHPSQERKHRASVPAVPSQARNGAPDLAPRFGPKKNVTPATVGLCEQVIYKCPRKRGPICAQRNGSRGAATAGTGRGNRMGGGSAMRMACRRAGDWCRGWPRAIGAGAVGHGTRGGVSAGVRKS